MMSMGDEELVLDRQKLAHLANSMTPEVRTKIEQKVQQLVP